MNRLSCAFVAMIVVCSVEPAMAAASETLKWQPASGGVISEATNWSPAQSPAATSEIDVDKVQSAPIALADDFHVYATKLLADSSGAEMVINMGGHEYLNEAWVQALKNTVYVFTNGTLKIGNNSEQHLNYVNKGATLAFRGTETIYFESNLVSSANGAMEIGGESPSVLEVANGAKFYRYMWGNDSLRVKIDSKIIVTNRSEMVVVANTNSNNALQTGYGKTPVSSNTRFELLDHSKLDFYGMVVCGASLPTTNGLFFVDGGSVVTNMNLGGDSTFRIGGTNNTLRIANGSTVTVPILEVGVVSDTCSALVEVDGGSTLRVGRANPASSGYTGINVGRDERSSGHRLVVRNNSKLTVDAFCCVGSGSDTKFPYQCSMEIRDSSAEFSGALCVGGFGSSNSLVLVNSALSCTNRGIGIGYKIAINNSSLSGSASLANRLEVENSTVNTRILDVNGYLNAAGSDGPKAVVRVAGTNSMIKTSANSRAAKFYNTELAFEIDPEGFVQTLIDIPKVDIASNSVVKVVLPTKARRLLGGTKITLMKTEANQLVADETTTFVYSAEMCDLVKDVANGEIYITVKQPPGLTIFVR